MQFQVYYRSWPHKNLRQISAEAESSTQAIADVTAMLVEEKEMHFKPLIAVVFGGKQ